MTMTVALPRLTLDQPLTGRSLAVVGLLLGLANFLVVLDLTIANVSVPVIAGSLSVSPSQGTWVITSYAIADAITVPLAGWLAARFGPVRTFVTAMALFGLFSALCGFATSFGMLIAMRICQGFAGGPLIPLSQALLIRVFGEGKQSSAIAVWGMTTLVGPVAGPLLGGIICDNYGWSWIFLANVPIAIGCALLVWSKLGARDDHPVLNPIDYFGLGLLALWVAALQYILDKGKELDWFHSPLIIAFAVISLVGFVAFLIWELTERHPAVNLRVLADRNFVACMMAVSIFYATIMGGGVLLTLWLQIDLGYSAVEAGKISGMNGLAAFFVSAVAAKLSDKIDPRKIAMTGMIIAALTFVARTGYTSEVDFWRIAWPTLLLGFSLPLAFMPIMSLALSSMTKELLASATGLLSFTRTVSGAFGVAIVTTLRDRQTTMSRADMVATLPSQNGLSDVVTLDANRESSLGIIDSLVGSQAAMQATNQLHGMIAVTLLLAAGCLVFVKGNPGIEKAD